MSDWERVEKYLRRIAETDAVTEEQLWNMGQRRGVESAGSELLPERVIESWSRFRKGEALTAQDKVELEAIVLPNGLRPVFDIKDDSFTDLPEPWHGLNQHRRFLESCIRGIGRLNVHGHPTLLYAGTAFVVGDRLLLTNRHVAEKFCQTGGSSMSFTQGVMPDFDVKQEVGSTASSVVKLAKPALILSDWDAALLRIDTMPPGVEPLCLGGGPPAFPSGRMAAIIGYPALDSRATTQEILQQIQVFRAIFDKKRLQPGRLLGSRMTVSFGTTVAALAHDCSTVGGNSGSAVIDVEGEVILGLHFGGEYLIANYSVPSWRLAENPQVREAGVTFS